MVGDPDAGANVRHIRAVSPTKSPDGPGASELSRWARAFPGDDEAERLGVLRVGLTLYLDELRHVKNRIETRSQMLRGSFRDKTTFLASRKLGGVQSSLP